MNLDAIKQMVIEHKDFEVVDSKSGEDLSKSILLQIIMESETNDQQSLLTNTLLKQLIRFYGGDMQLFLRQYLEQSLAMAVEQQEGMQAVVKNLGSGNPMAVFNQMLEQNMKLWNPSKK